MDPQVGAERVGHDALAFPVHIAGRPLCLFKPGTFFAGQNPQLGSPVGVFDGVGGKQVPKSRITHIKVVWKLGFRMGRAEGSPVISGDPQL